MLMGGSHSDTWKQCVYARGDHSSGTFLLCKKKYVLPEIGFCLDVGVAKMGVSKYPNSTMCNKLVF